MHSSERRKIWVMTIAQAAFVLAMSAVFALLGKYTPIVLLSGIAGGAVAVLNFFLLSYFAALAADKAQQQDVIGGQKLLRLSYLGRMAAVVLILSLCAKMGLHPLALALPLMAQGPMVILCQWIGSRKAAKTHGTDH